jgi:hypothetical protein
MATVRELVTTLRVGLTIAGALLACAVHAQSAGTTSRVRGTVEAVDGTRLLVKTREGGTVVVGLRDGWTIGGIKEAKLSDIKPGSFVGAAAMNRGDELVALEVLIFPEGVRSNEGHYGWDLLPESTMTNATVGSTVQSIKGPVLTLTYSGGEKKVIVPTDVPVVTFAPAEKSDLVPGAPIFIPAQKADDGSLSAGRVIVGNNGIAPPM